MFLLENGLWKERIDDLTMTSIKFELIMRSPRQHFTISTALDVSGNSDVKVGSFVMYNCSRLATLFKNFEEKVSQGQPSRSDLKVLPGRDGVSYMYIWLYTKDTEVLFRKG